MSRTEELKNKLKNRNFDKKFSDFNVKLENFLKNERSASAIQSDFPKIIYAEYKKGGFSDVDKWIAERLQGLFISEDNPPTWPYEPDWCFYENNPMEFIGQLSDKQGTVFFLFRYNYKKDQEIREVYKMLAQDNEGKIHMKGEIMT